MLLATLILVTSVVLLAASYVLVAANLSYSAPPPPLGGPNPQLAGAPVKVIGAQLAHHERAALLVQYAVILGVLIVIAATVAWVVAGRLLRPLRMITAGAKRITGDRLQERLALDGPPDEIKDLGDTFDAMLARLEVAFQDQQLFAANAAHELRTPLGVMNAELDLALNDQQPSEQQQMLLRLKRTVVTCERLTERLLTLTRGQLAATERQPVALDELVAKRLSLAESAARRLTFQEDLPPLVIDGDPALLGQLVENLIENAIRYNVPHGWIEVRLHGDGERATLEVANSGPPLADHDLAGLLEPFRRAAQHRVGAGNGLGLSIVRAIVAAHNGQLALDALPDGGLRVTVTLPSSGQPDTSAAAQQSAVHERS